MAQNITLFGASYTDVPAVLLPKTGGGTAQFDDTTILTNAAAAANIMSGKQAYANGALITGTQGLKVGVLRPDAELMKTFTYDAMIVSDEQVTLPSYSTTATTLKASAALEETYTPTSLDDYDWYILVRTLTIPSYSVSSKAKGRAEYTINSAMYEVYRFPGNTFHALIDTTVYRASAVMGLVATGVLPVLVYWSSGTVVTTQITSVYGPVQGIVAPTMADGVITFNTPSFSMRGHTTYFTKTYYNALTDIRYQWRIEVWRAPKNNFNLDGWGQIQQGMHVVGCVDTNSKDLT